MRRLGVERIDLTHEYQLATTRYRLHYRELKTLSRASLEHGFLPGASLWRAPDGSQVKSTTPTMVRAGAYLLVGAILTGGALYAVNNVI